MDWSIKHNSTTKKVADWGLSQVRRELVSQGIDRITFKADEQDVDSNTLFAWGDMITLYRGAVIWFVGLVTKTPRSGTPGGESMDYEVSGPWWYLENLVFAQQQKFFAGYTTPNNPSTPPTFSTVTSTHVWLNKYDTMGVRLNSQDQIIQILNWAIANSAPIQIGTVEPAVDIITDERRDITCAEGLKSQLRWAPDAVTWFDYTTTPPTLNIGRRGSLTPVSISPVNGLLTESIDIASREDIQVPLVYITYEIEQEDGGSTWIVKVTDKYDAAGHNNGSTPNFAFKALITTIQLQGAKSPGQSVKIVTAPIPFVYGCPGDPLSSDAITQFWKDNSPDLARTDYINPATVKVSPECRQILVDEILQDPNDYPNMLLDGQIAPWMNVTSARETITGVVQYATWATTLDSAQYPMSFSIQSTNAKTGTYKDHSQDSAGEPVPQNLARDLYLALAELQYDGSVTIVEDEITGLVGIGNVLNLTGTAQNWSGMNAMVVSVSEDLYNGKTTIAFGPKKNYGAADLVEILRAARTRRLLLPVSFQGNPNQDSNQTQLGNALPKQDKIDGLGFRPVVAVSSIAKPDDAKNGIGGYNANTTQAAGKIIHSVVGKDAPDAFSGAAPMKVVSTWSGKVPGTGDHVGDGSVTIDLDEMKVAIKPQDGSPEKKQALDAKFRAYTGCDSAGNRRKVLLLGTDYFDPTPPTA